MSEDESELLDDKSADSLGRHSQASLAKAHSTPANRCTGSPSEV